MIAALRPAKRIHRTCTLSYRKLVREPRPRRTTAYALMSTGESVVRSLLHSVGDPWRPSLQTSTSPLAEGCGLSVSGDNRGARRVTAPRDCRRIQRAGRRNAGRPREQMTGATNPDHVLARPRSSTSRTAVASRDHPISSGLESMDALRTMELSTRSIAPDLRVGRNRVGLDGLGPPTLRRACHGGGGNGAEIRAVRRGRLERGRA